MTYLRQSWWNRDLTKCVTVSQAAVQRSGSCNYFHYWFISSLHLWGHTVTKKCSLLMSIWFLETEYWVQWYETESQPILSFGRLEPEACHLTSSWNDDSIIIWSAAVNMQLQTEQTDTVHSSATCRSLRALRVVDELELKTAHYLYLRGGCYGYCSKVSVLQVIIG